jgi:hypothetical protein
MGDDQAGRTERAALLARAGEPGARLPGPTEPGRVESCSGTVGPDVIGTVPAVVAVPDVTGGVDPATVLAAAVPGGGLAVLLERLDLDTLGDGDLVEVVAAASRLEGWARALAAQGAAVLADRPAMNPVWSAAAGGAPVEAGVAGDEIAMRLACSRRAATRLVRHGRAYARTLCATGDALAAGTISPVTAGMIADRLADQPVEIALDVQDRVLPEAGRRTPTQIARDLERALIAVDPGEAAVRAERARTRRCVHRPRPLPDGMASLTAVLPAATACRIDATLESAARTARAAGDSRTLDQLRADGLSDLVLHTTCTGPGLTPLLLPDDSPAAHGPASTTTGTDLDPAAPARTGCGAGPHHRTEIRVTVALSTLLGQDDHPADLSGHGPIDATTARALAAGGTWRRLVTDPLSGTVLDVGRTRYRPPADLARHVQTRDRTCARPGCTAPAETCDLDHTIEYHAPPAPQVEGTALPAATPATHDTTAPRTPTLGTTAAHNLGPLCRRDHRLKTDGGFALCQTAPGVFEWTTPTGHRYRTTPGNHERSEALPPLGPPPF